MNNKSLLWRGILILAVAAIMVLTIWPPKQKIKLGLDLRGGIHLVLRVKVEDALRADRDKTIERLTQEAASQGVANLQVQALSPTSFAVTAAGSAAEKVSDIQRKYLSEWEKKSQSGRLVFSLPDNEVKRLEDMAVNQAQQTIENRINAFGVAEPTIQRQGIGAGSDRIVVQLPGVEDPERVKSLIKNTAFLEFRIVEGGPFNTQQEALGAYNGQIPPNLEVLDGDIKDPDTRQVTSTQFYVVQKAAKVTGRDGGPIVEFMLTHDGGERFGDLTGANVNKGLAIVLDRRVVSAPRINQRITDQGIIEGRFTQQEVDDLSTVLRTGALPAGIETLEERTVGPSLGQDSIRKGILSFVVGSALVIAFMLVYYRGGGAIADAALLINVLLMIGAFAAFGFTLSLPGIAGIVLTIGMAVDANVLILERIREELRLGKSPRAAIDAGYERAWYAIRDSNITTFCSGLILFNFGTGPVRGFAVTLCLGILTSLLTGVFGTRVVYDLLVSRRRLATVSV